MILKQLDDLRGKSVCLHMFSHPGKRGELFARYGRYWLDVHPEPLIEINPAKVEVIEEDHIYLKGYNGNPITQQDYYNQRG